MFSFVYVLAVCTLFESLDSSRQVDDGVAMSRGVGRRSSCDVTSVDVAIVVSVS